MLSLELAVTANKGLCHSGRRAKTVHLASNLATTCNSTHNHVCPITRRCPYAPVGSQELRTLTGM